jgi:predicted nucleic acid-binding protein
VIVVDTGGLLALLNGQDRHHRVARISFEQDGACWIVPWAVLPELDYLAAKCMSEDVARAFLEDVRDGAFRVDAHVEKDLARAAALRRKYGALSLGLVDTVVMAQAERHRAEAILTTDGRHFRAVKLAIAPPPALLLLDG